MGLPWILAMAPKDPRFSRLATDPRFIRPSKASQKVVLDERFKSLLADDGENDKEIAKVDKYGRRISKDSRKKDLKRFYRLEEAGNRGIDRARGEGLIESSSEEDDSDDHEGEEEATSSSAEESGSNEIILGSQQARAANNRLRRAPSELSIDLNEEEPIASTSTSDPSQVESSIPTIQNATSRIAVVNLDWDNVHAIDLFKVFDSVLSPCASGLIEMSSIMASKKSKTRIGKGRVESVKIYPSEFGKARLAREEKEGPPVQIFGRTKKNVSTGVLSRHKPKKRPEVLDEEDEEEDSPVEDGGEDYDEQALRRYQLERLRYGAAF